MRTSFLVTFIFLSCSAWTQPLQKKITIELSNITLEKALTILSISYEVEFSYSDDVVPTQEIVNLSIQNETLTAVLNKLLGIYNVGYKINGNRVLLKRSPIIFTQTIRGSVRDEITNTPLPGVTILVRGNNIQLGGSTDSRGEFRINDVPVGRISLTLSCVGFNTRFFENVLVSTGKEMVLDLKISESVTAMNELMITAQQSEVIPGDGVALTSSKSFSVEETKRYAGSMGDPARMVTAFAGVTSASDESNALIVRGNSPRGMLWRIEGVEVPNPNHFTTEGSSGGVVSILSPNIIERSDFLTGAFPAQYGNALSGVFDVQLRTGNNEKNEYSFQTGLLGIEASAEGPFSKRQPSSFLINYRYSTLSILDKLNFELSDAGQYKDYQDLSFKIHHPTSSAGAFTIFGIGGKSQSDKRNVAVDKSISDLGVLGITYQGKINETSYLESALSFSGTQIAKNNELAGFGTEPIRVEESYRKAYIRSSLSLKKRISSHYVLEAGSIYSLLDFKFYLRNRDPGNTPYQEIVNFSENGKTSIAQGFLFARQYFSSSLFSFYGIHFLNFALTRDYSLEPRAGLRWQPSETTAWSIAVGKHSRIENLQYYLARDHQAGGNEVQINKDLGFTRANHFVLAYERALTSHHRVKIESYYQRLYNAPVQLDPSVLYSSLNEDTGFITDTLVNKGKGRNYGIELSLEKTLSDNFYYMINSSLYESLFTVDEQVERNTSYNGNYSIHALIGKEFSVNRRQDQLGLNLKFTSAGGRPFVPIDVELSIQRGTTTYSWESAFEEKLPDYFRADFQFIYKKNHPRYSVEWRLDIQNFTDHRNASNYYFNASDGSVRLKKQVGFLPLLSCRIDF